ncbi:hypothetical protein B6N58_07375 [Legionella micdadei]|uniref:Uncharacterized protein n=2 Tax=Legionella micdadei TaxID=451 RepID=A0A098GG95_LEGMI|nr:hypothetical protein B6N58_07375 [Legionella micdadei]ARH00191.1 hypothetical protein B6V88_07045 [Legionella micdadei]KTD28397.1 hypothetical protein Lmic_1508 [Legionella micdadei]NSL17024.1 hypothetical protein [Legionella micdadei]CEG61010.1 exported protein of unknown function [Legionella micdadei]
MKSRVLISLFTVGLLTAFTIHASTTTSLLLKGKEAKRLYNYLTGSSVQQEGAAGHLYRRGTSILCRYTDVDMTKNGKKVPKHASCRYACTVNFDHNGHASPGQNA